MLVSEVVVLSLCQPRRIVEGPKLLYERQEPELIPDIRICGLDLGPDRAVVAARQMSRLARLASISL